MSGIYTAAELARRYDQRWRPFWTCPITGFDCRREPEPALAIIHSHDVPMRLQMYATASLADRATPMVIECCEGMSADFLLDVILHYGAKGWVDATRFLEVMTELAWHFGNRSWAFCAGSGNPRIVGRPAG